MSEGRHARPLRAGLVVVLGLLTGCALLWPRPPLPPPTPDAATARAVAERRDEESRTLSASFRITVKRRDGETESARGALAVARPDRLRLQLFSLGFLTVFDYTVNGDRYRIRQQGKSGIRYGTVGDDRTLAPAQWLARLFLGGGRGTLEIRRVEDGYVVERRERGGRRELFVPDDAAVVREETLRVEGRVLLHARYGDFSKVDGAWLPRSIEAEAPAAGVTLSIAVDEYERNRPIADDVFSLGPR